MLSAVCPDAGEECDITAARAVVIAFQGRNTVGVGTDHGDRPDFRGIQRKDSVVIQQHHAFFRSLQSQFIMLIRVGGSHGNAVVFTVVIEQAQEAARCKETDAGGGNLFFRNKPLPEGFYHMQVSVSAVQVTAVFEGERSALRRSIRNLMVDMEITDGPAVADNMPLKSPFFAERFLQQCLTSAGWLPVHPVVGAHNGLDFRFLHGRFKRREICFGHVFRVRFRVKLMAQRLRTGMNSKMFAAGGCFEVLAVALEPPDEPDAKSGRQVRILAVCFMAAAPTRVSENVDIRAPYGQPLIDIPVTVAALAVVFCSRFFSDRTGDLFLHIFIKHGREADRLRKHGRGTCTGHAVKHFIPPVVSRDSEPGNGRRVISELGSFFLKRHFSDEFPRFFRRFCSVSH